MLADIYSYNAVSDPVKNLPEPVSSVWRSRLKILCASSLERRKLVLKPACISTSHITSGPQCLRQRLSVGEAGPTSEVNLYRLDQGLLASP